MAQEDIELVKAVHPPTGTDLVQVFGEDVLGSGRLDALASLLTPDFEAVGGDIGPGLSPGGSGLAGLVESWREWLEPWETYRVEVEGFIDAGDGRVVVLNRDHGRLSGSDSDIDAIGAAIWTIRDGKIARIEFHANRRSALAAAGLEDVSE